MNDDLEKEFRMVASEVLLSDTMDEGAEHVRKLATRVAQRMGHVNASQRAIDRAFKEFMATHGEDLLDDPELMKKVREREAILLRAGMSGGPELWHRAANDVRRRYGDANSRVIRGMRQQRFAARYAGDTESYQFDTGADDPNVDAPMEADEEELARDRTEAISQLRIANIGRPNQVDRQRYNEIELRRRQRNDR